MQIRANGNEKDVGYEALAKAQSGEVHWHCPCCFGRHRPMHDNPKRLLTLGASSNLKGEDVFSAYIGELSKAQAAELDFLRACDFAKKLDGKPLNRETMLEALNDLANSADFHLKEHPQARLVHSAKPMHHERYYTHRIFSRCSILSLPASGVEVRCLLMDQRKVPTLNPCAVDAILGFIASMTDFAVCPKEKRREPAMKAAERRLGGKRDEANTHRWQAAAASVGSKDK